MRLFKDFLVFLNYPSFDSSAYSSQLLKLIGEWESLRNIRELYIKIMKEDQSYKYDKIF